MTLVNILSKDYNFRVTHGIDLGKKEGQLPTGKKDGQRSAYNFGVHLERSKWKCQINRVQNKHTQLVLEYMGESFKSVLQGQVIPSAGLSQWDLDMSYKILDMTVETKLNTSPSIGFAFTQPLSTKIGIGSLVNFYPFADKAQLKVLTSYNNKQDPKCQAYLSLTTGMGADEVQACYMHEIITNINLIVATDFSFAKKSLLPGGDKDWVSILKCGYSYESRNSGQSVQGLFDTVGNVSTLITAPLTSEISLMASGNMNYSKNVYDFGLGVQIPL